MNAKSFDAKYFREKVAICQRLADSFSLNNPGRFQLMDIAEDLEELAKELEVQVATASGVCSCHPHESCILSHGRSEA